MSNEKTTQKRGQLTDRIKQKSIELFGYEMSQNELRLLPYIQYTACNDQRLNTSNINGLEQTILARYVEKGYIVDGVSNCGRPMISEGVKLRITKDFWVKMCEIIYLGYVDLKN